MYNRIYLNDDWTYYREENPDSKEIVRLPHTNVELPFHYFDEALYQFVSVYERDLFIPEDYHDKVLKLRFEGAGHHLELYVNDQLAGSHDCGYTEFTPDITSYVNPGQNNHIKVVLDARESLNQPPFGYVIDYLTYGGLYREVSLEVYEQAYIRDVFVYADDLTEDVKRFSAQVTSNLPASVNAHLSLDLYDGSKLLRSFDEGTAVAGERTYALYSSEALLWTPEQPHLYQLVARLTEGDKTWDVKTVTFGLRKAEFKADGFYLNGCKRKIRGLNRHQSYPYVGYAMPKSVQEQEVSVLLDELGVNAVRTSHYPQSQYFLDECDRRGLLVFTEAPGWQHIGDRSWKQQHLTNVEDMVLQNRNHPSIILWGVRINESQDDDALYKKANEIAHRLDPSRQTSGVRYIQYSNLLEDVFAFNDFTHSGNNAALKKKFMVTTKLNKGYLVSEHNGHMYPTKEFDDESHRLSQTLRHARVLNEAYAQDNGIAGAFGWCMADYNTHKDFGSGDKICYHGVLDMFRNPKMAAALYASQQDKFDVFEVSSSMNIGEYPGGRLGDVYAFTNADYVKMYKNGDFVARFDPDWETYPNLPHPPVRIDDYVGALLETKEGLSSEGSKQLRKAIRGYNRNGYAGVLKPQNVAGLGYAFVHEKLTIPRVTELALKYVGNWGSDATIYQFEAIRGGKVVKTIVIGPLNDMILKTRVSNTTLTEGSTYDVGIVNLEAVSAEGNRLVYCNDPVKLRTEGPIELIGPDVVPLRGGAAGTYVKTTGEAGDAKLILETDRTGQTEIAFHVVIDKGITG